MTARCVTGLVAALLAAATIAAAQGGGKPVVGGNPTPGTTQPDPPNLADRVTLTGCLQPAPADASKANVAVDDNTPTDWRFVLTGAERVGRVPPGTGTSGLAARTNSRRFRLEGIDSQFSPFVNTRVEISGEVKPATTGVPALLVEFVRKLASRC